MIYAGPARQPYAHADNTPGEPTRDPITNVLYKIGQVGPRAEDDWNMSHGRYLAGLGGENETQAPWDPDFKTDFMRDLELEDDVFGSGIFDTYGRGPTVNPDMGVFADNPSLPGFIDREIQYTVSQDIYDITSGADVITVAGGGMTYQERGGLPVPFNRIGPTPCPPPRMLPPPTDLRQVYVGLNPTPPVMKAPAPTQGVFKPLPGPAVPPQFTPGLIPMVASVPPPAITNIPQVPGTSQMGYASIVNPVRPMTPGVQAIPAPGTPFSRVPFQNQQLPTPMMQIVNPAVTQYPVDSSWKPEQLPMSSQDWPVGFRPIVDTGVPQLPVPAGVSGLHGLRGFRGLGIDEKTDSPGWGTYIFAGLLVGASAALFYGAMNVKKKRA